MSELAHIVEIYYQLVGSCDRILKDLLLLSEGANTDADVGSINTKTNRFRKFIATLFIDMEIIYGLNFFTVTKRLAKAKKPGGQWNDVKRIIST